MNLADGGTELIRGPMGVMHSQTISTFVAGFVLVLVALAIIFNLVNSRTGRAIMAARTTASPPRAWASASPSTR